MRLTGVTMIRASKYLLFFLPLLLIHFSCGKDKQPCGGFKTYPAGVTLIDYTPLHDYPRFLDTLNKYPNLQPFRVSDDSIAIIVSCYLYSQGLPVFSEHYQMIWGKRFPGFSELGEKSIDTVLSITPQISQETAEGYARNAEAFESGCIHSQLGLFDRNAGYSFTPPDYALVWYVQGSRGAPFVICDARDGSILRQGGRTVTVVR